VSRRSRLAAAAVAAALLTSVLLGTTGGPVAAQAATSTPPTTDGTPKHPERIVQLGDSIASGEGTLYGYTYNAKKGEWTAGDVDVKWPPPYPACHVSDDAYGRHVASTFHATFSQFACTGATFANGISAPETSGGTTLRPAEFGNWATQQHLNAEYDKARPDTVLVTLGADDAQFVAIVENCIENGYKYKFYLADEECIPSNPGSTIQKDFFSFIPTLRRNYATLISWIDARAKARSPEAARPKIVFTTYANPFPNAGTACPDVNYLYPEQTAYLSSLVDEMNATIISSVPTLGSSTVAVADISHVYQPAGSDHRWCTSDPWAYGLSIYSVYHPSSYKSQAPFHPTPEGQARIAAAVTPTVLALFNNRPTPVPTSTSTSMSTTSTVSPTTATTLPETTTSTG
jgi:lysophospholipase L1-like esterase